MVYCSFYCALCFVLNILVFRHIPLQCLKRATITYGAMVIQGHIVINCDMVHFFSKKKDQDEEMSRPAGILPIPLRETD